MQPVEDFGWRVYLTQLFHIGVILLHEDTEPCSSPQMAAKQQTISPTVLVRDFRHRSAARRSYGPGSRAALRPALCQMEAAHKPFALRVLDKDADVIPAPSESSSMRLASTYQGAGEGTSWLVEPLWGVPDVAAASQYDIRRRTRGDRMGVEEEEEEEEEVEDEEEEEEEVGNDAQQRVVSLARQEPRAALSGPSRRGRWNRGSRHERWRSCPPQLHDCTRKPAYSSTTETAAWTAHTAPLRKRPPFHTQGLPRQVTPTSKRHVSTRGPADAVQTQGSSGGIQAAIPQPHLTRRHSGLFSPGPWSCFRNR
ncbi:unnamed protein product [Lota lota]